MNNFKRKEIIIIEFAIDIMSNPFEQLNSLAYAPSKKNLKKLSSILILAISDLIKNKDIKKSLEMKQFIRNRFYQNLINLNNFDVTLGINEISSINDINISISFFIWCIDSFCYFIEESNSPYLVIKNYAKIMENSLERLNVTSDIFEISDFFCKSLLA